MVRSHISAPAVYLKNFRIQKGQRKDNSDPLHVYDKITGTWHFNCNTRDRRFTIYDFFSNDIEVFNSTNFETYYPPLYSEVVNSYSMGLDIPLKNQEKMKAFIANLRARHISDNLPNEFRNDSEVRNNIIPPVTEVIQNGYHNEIVYIYDPGGEFITSDSPLLSVIPTTLLISNASIRVLPLDFEHIVMLLQWRKSEDYRPIRSVFDAWNNDPRKAAFFICAEEIIAAKRYIFFKNEGTLKGLLETDYVKQRLNMAII